MGPGVNAAIDLVATQWAAIADVTDAAVELLHHPRKTGDARSLSRTVEAHPHC